MVSAIVIVKVNGPMVDTSLTFLYFYFPKVLRATGGDKGNKKQMINAMVAMFLPDVAKYLKLSLFDEESMKFLANVVKSTVAHRRKENIRRGDLIDIVLEALAASEEDVKETEDDQFEKDASVHSEYKIPKDEIETLLVANAIILFFAGFDTTSTAVGVTLGYLAKLPDIQEKLFQEINDAMEENGTRNLDYETVQKLPYLDQVFYETLRYYFTGNIERVCTKDYKLPGTEFVVPKGMLIQIPSSALHREDKYYPDPDNFNPEVNFSPEAKANRSPYAFMSFGQGPRNCIGMRFALLMAKMCLAKVVGSFKLKEGPSMPKEFILSAATFSGLPIGGIWCEVEKR